MVTKMKLTKELHDLRQEAKDLMDKSLPYFHDLMIDINATKVRINWLNEHKLSVMYGEKNAPK